MDGVLDRSGMDPEARRNRKERHFGDDVREPVSQADELFEREVTPREGMSATFSGRYPIERRAGEMERLHVQSAAFARDVEAMLDLVGVRQGWSCIDLGCGPGGITEPLSRRPGPNGRVAGLDKDAEFLEHARTRASANIEFRQRDANASQLPRH